MQLAAYSGSAVNRAEGLLTALLWRYTHFPFRFAEGNMEWFHFCKGMRGTTEICCNLRQADFFLLLGGRSML